MEACKLCKCVLVTDIDMFLSQGYCNSCANRYTRYSTVPVHDNMKRNVKAEVVVSADCCRCGDSNHTTKNCRTKLCLYCNRRGHLADQCYTNPKNCCSKCKMFGHSMESCKSCERCGDSGHSKNECRTKICESCKKRGHSIDRCWNMKNAV